MAVGKEGAGARGWGVGTYAVRHRGDVRVPGEKSLAEDAVPKEDQDHRADELGGGLSDDLSKEEGTLVSL